MKLETFKYIWEQGIAKAAQDVLEEITPDLQTKYSVHADVSEAMCDKLYHEYETVRQVVRKRYFDTGKDEENRIDGHKICACITGALLNVRMISYSPVDDEMPIKVVYANYEVAFLASIYAMYLFVLSDFQREGKEECYDELIKQSTFIFPETNPGHDSYAQGRIKTLALNDLNGNDFDVLMYADMLFWIEKYNKELINNKVQIECD